MGELYLEYHRGVLTTQGRTKRLNRRAEHDLVAAEVHQAFAAFGGAPLPASLEAQWRVLMINQFHDILPRSSIAEVYARTEAELNEVIAAMGGAADEAMARIAAGLSAGGPAGLLIVQSRPYGPSGPAGERRAPARRPGGRGRLCAGLRGDHCNR